MKLIDNILLVPIAGAHYSSIGFFIDAGSIHEDDVPNGTAHLLEHVLTGQITSGVPVGARTELEQMVFYSSQLPGDTGLSLKEIGEVLLHAPISKINFLNQKKRLSLELDTVYIHDTFKDMYRELFGEASGQYRGWSGTVSSIESVGFDALIDYRSRYIVPERIVVVVTGNFDEDDVISEIDRLNLRCPLTQRKNRDSSLKHEKIVWMTHAREAYADVDIFIPSCALGDVKKRAIDTIFLSTMTGMSLSLIDSLLYKQIGSVYEVHSELMHWTNGGVCALGYRTIPSVAEESADRVHELILNLPNVLNEKIFSSAKKHTLINHAVSMSDLEQLVLMLGQELLLNNILLSYGEKRDLIQSCTIDDLLNRVQQIAKLPIAVIKK